VKNKRLINNPTLFRAIRKREKRVLLIVAALFVFCYFTASREFSETQAAEFFPAHWSGRIFGQNYGVFSHSVRAHAEINCNSCHQRSDNSATPRFAGHSSCIDCHLSQFVTPQSPICSICHSNVQTASAPMRAFPTSFNERFNMKFDHAAHNRGDGRPAEGCAACHKPLRGGVALSIPVNLAAHNQCFSCHTPNRTVGGRDIGSCSTCHSIANYRRTPTTGVAFRANFSHADHGSRQRLGCADCHTVRAGAPQSKQVSSPIATKHIASSRAMNCMTCHNDKRAFGDRDFANCKRCHTGPTFDMIR
jgi:hypothetical protein